MTDTKTLPCPICKKTVDITSANVPFCSDRCRLIDLGKWASGDYKISSPVLDPDLLEDISEQQLRRQPAEDEE